MMRTTMALMRVIDNDDRDDGDDDDDASNLRLKFFSNSLSFSYFFLQNGKGPIVDDATMMTMTLLMRMMKTMTMEVHH